MVLLPTNRFDTLDLRGQGLKQMMNNCIHGEMVSVLVSSVVDCGFEPDQVKPKTMKLVFVAFS